MRVSVGTDFSKIVYDGGCVAIGNFSYFRFNRTKKEIYDYLENVFKFIEKNNVKSIQLELNFDAELFCVEHYDKLYEYICKSNVESNVESITYPPYYQYCKFDYQTLTLKIIKSSKIRNIGFTETCATSNYDDEFHEELMSVLKNNYRIYDITFTFRNNNDNTDMNKYAKYCSDINNILERNNNNYVTARRAVFQLLMLTAQPPPKIFPNGVITIIAKHLYSTHLTHLFFFSRNKIKNPRRTILSQRRREGQNEPPKNKKQKKSRRRPEGSTREGSERATPRG